MLSGFSVAQVCEKIRGILGCKLFEFDLYTRFNGSMSYVMLHYL